MIRGFSAYRNVANRLRSTSSSIKISKKLKRRVAGLSPGPLPAAMHATEGQGVVYLAGWIVISFLRDEERRARGSLSPRKKETSPADYLCGKLTRHGAVSFIFHRRPTLEPPMMPPPRYQSSNPFDARVSRRELAGLESHLAKRIFFGKIGTHRCWGRYVLLETKFKIRACARKR